VGVKDRLLETLALPALNATLLAPYGRARELRLDTESRRAELVLDLEGEREPLRICVGRYQVFEQDGGTFVALYDVETSRRWMTELARRNVAGQAIPLPRELAGIVSRFV
jgi:hypothetical protein